jgi:hypothetical protein
MNQGLEFNNLLDYELTWYVSLTVLFCVILVFFFRKLKGGGLADKWREIWELKQVMDYATRKRRDKDPKGREPSVFFPPRMKRRRVPITNFTLFLRRRGKRRILSRIIRTLAISSVIYVLLKMYVLGIPMDISVLQ